MAMVFCLFLGFLDVSSPIPCHKTEVSCHTVLIKKFSKVSLCWDQQDSQRNSFWAQTGKHSCASKLAYLHTCHLCTLFVQLTAHVVTGIRALPSLRHLHRKGGKRFKRVMTWVCRTSFMNSPSLLCFILLQWLCRMWVLGCWMLRPHPESCQP